MAKYETRTMSLLVVGLMGSLLACGEISDSSPAIADATVDTNMLDAMHHVPDASNADALPNQHDFAYIDDGIPDMGTTADNDCRGEYPCVTQFPFVDEGDTHTDGEAIWDRYPCKATADESGPEVVYEIMVPEEGFLSAAVYDGEGVDVDVHILAGNDPESCVSRGHHHAAAMVEAGRHYVVVDSFASDGEIFSGEFRVEIGLYVPSRGPCEMESGVMPRVRDDGHHLEMPATGPMVLEAHLVTAEEPAPFPSTPTEELAAHYALSQDTTGLVMHRRQRWAPLEGGRFYGAGIGPARLLPVEDESWYVNMYWTRDARPNRGDRMILRLPDSDLAVVVSAGHETGPGNLDFIGGTPEEPHFFLGTTHRDVLTLGLATDQALPFGPRICED